MSFANSPTDCISLRLPSAEYFAGNQHARVVGPTRQLLDSFVLVADVELMGVKPLRLQYRLLHHLFASLEVVVVVPSEVDSPVHAVGEQGMVVACCYQVDGIL